MYKLPLNTVKERIYDQAKISSEELTLRVNRKMEELAGLISEEGAAHIIANELGVKLYQENQILKIKDLQPGMRNTDIAGKVTRVFEIRHFQNEHRTGKVGSFIIGDETGTTRVTLWNEQADNLNNIKEGETIKIQNSYIRENNGRAEIHLNDNSKIVHNPEGVSIEEVKTRAEANRKNIKELQETDTNIEITGTITQVFDPRYFTVCPNCNKRIHQKEDGTYTCAVHQQTEPSYNYVMNIILDDGTETIRAVLWKNQTDKLLNKTSQEVLAYKEKPEEFSHIKTDLLGEQLKLIGNVKKNEMFQRLEFNTQLVFPLNPEEEIQRLQR